MSLAEGRAMLALHNRARTAQSARRGDKRADAGPRVRNLRTLGGLSLTELLRRTIKESWQDEVFGQGGRMSFYHFLAIFPSIVVFLAFSAHIPQVGDQTKNALQDLSRQLLPSEVSRLMQSVLDDLSGRSLAGMRL